MRLQTLGKDPLMYHPTQQNTEVLYRQKNIRAEYIRAQRQVSIAGVRQIIGNTVIEIGGRIHGVAQSSCTEAAEARGKVRDVIRTSDAGIQATIIH